jgi:flagellar hook-basal body complex protein FliE
MTNGFFQKVNFSTVTGNFSQNMPVDLTGRIQNTPSLGLDSTDGVSQSSFKGVMSGLVSNLNTQMNAPDQLLQASMNGDSSVDIHDVMTAMSKAEISVNVATQLTSKVIQAYDKIMQISV